MALDRAPVTAGEMELDEKDGPPKKTPQQIALLKKLRAGNKIRTISVEG